MVIETCNTGSMMGQDAKLAENPKKGKVYLASKKHNGKARKQRKLENTMN